MGKRQTGRRQIGRRNPETGEPARRGDAQARRQVVIDGMLADALRPALATSLPGQDALAPDIRGAIAALLAKAAARRTRCLTYEDLEASLPPRDVSAEDLEAIFWVLAEHGIEVEDGES